MSWNPSLAVAQARYDNQEEPNIDPVEVRVECPACGWTDDMFSDDLPLSCPDCDHDELSVEDLEVDDDWDC